MSITLINSIHIPSELRARHQWVSWRYVLIPPSTKPTKVPYNSRTGEKCDVTDPSQWSDFATAEHATIYCDGVGYCLSPNDPYTFIDLDNVNKNSAAIVDAHSQIYHALNSYSEWSPSGEGIHIIIKASVPVGKNSRRHMMEIYSAGRFFTFTGNVLNNTVIAERQELAMQIWADLGGENEAAITISERPQSVEDSAIYDIAAKADNSAKFSRLWEGHWQGEYPSQSEADQALIDILQFYTKNIPQIMRMFRLSALGRRDKARRDDYVMRTIRRSFDRELPLIDIDYSPLEKQTNEQNGITRDHDITFDPIFNTNYNNGVIITQLDFNGSTHNSIVKLDLKAAANPFQRPFGLLGDIAQFVYEAAPRPINEASLSAAIVMMAGLCGRAFNVHGAGLNHYLLFMGRTAVGKESMASGISRLMNELAKEVPAVEGFRGPGDIASAPGLTRFLSKSPTKSVFSIFGEFGIKLQTMTDDSPMAVNKALYGALLSLYTKSGRNQQYDGSIYASTDNNISAIKSPNYSFLGEGVPESFYSSLEEKHVTSGLIPRLILIEYLGNRPKLNRDSQNAMPSRQLLDKLSELTDFVLKRMQTGVICDMKFTVEAAALDAVYNEECDIRINKSNRSVIRDIWSRAYLKVAKLSALAALSRNFYEACINEVDYVWARNIIEYESGELVEKFRKGNLVRDVANLEAEQTQIIGRMMYDFHNTDFYNCHFARTTLDSHKQGIVMTADIMMKTAAMASFKRDRFQNQANKMNRAVEMLKAMGFIEEVNTQAAGKIARAVRIADFQGLEKFVFKFD